MDMSTDDDENEDADDEPCDYLNLTSHGLLEVLKRFWSSLHPPTARSEDCAADEAAIEWFAEITTRGVAWVKPCVSHACDG